jgi:peptide/nickel transport system permease protein
VLRIREDGTLGNFLVRRLLQTIPTLIGMTMLVFAIINLVPGGPFDHLRLDNDIRPQDIERLEAHLGLDQPLHLRYFAWLSHVARGDLGESFRNRLPVTQLILRRLPNTLLLTGTSLLLTLLIAVPVGIASAVRRDRAFDVVAGFLAVGGFSIPIFWLSLMLINVFAIEFSARGWPALPAGGAYDLRSDGGVFDRLEHMLLPVLALTLVGASAWSRFVRLQMLEVLRHDHVVTAAAKGLHRRAIILRHALRHAMLPLATLLGYEVPALFSGSLVVESVFGYPGMGHLAYTAAFQKDYPVIMGVVLISGLLVMFGNLLADLLYALVDPRIRYR